MQPFDYTLTVDDPVKEAIAGYNAGLDGQATRAEMARRDELVGLEERRVDQGDRRIDLAEQQFGAQRAQVAAARQAQAEEFERVSQMHRDLTSLAENEHADSQDFMRILIKYPDLSDHLAAPWESLTEQRKAEDLLSMAQLYTAVKGGNIDVAREMLEERFEAQKNSGLVDEAAATKAAIGLLDADLKEALLMQLGVSLKALGGEKYDSVLDTPPKLHSSTDIGSNITKQVMSDGDVRVVNNATGEELKGEDAQAAIDASAQAEIDRKRNLSEANDLGKTLAEAKVKLEPAIKKTDAALKLISDIKKDPALPSITGMLQGRMPPLTQEGTDLNVKIQQLQGRVFLEAFDALKGGGVITEIEGLKAEQALGRLNRAQSFEAYQDALDELSSLLEGYLDSAKKRAGISDVRANSNMPEHNLDDLQAEVDQLFQMFR